METKPFDFARMIRRMKEDKAAINQYLEQHSTLKGFKGAKIYKLKKKYPLNIDGTDLYFVTEQGIQYHIYLTEGADYLPEAPFSHLIQMIGFHKRDSDQPVRFDSRVRNTIIEGIRFYFDQNPDLILTYVCDMMDGRQQGREQLFDTWYRAFKSEYAKLVYTDGQMTYCGMIFRPEHPYRSQLEISVEQYIREKLNDNG